MTIIRLGGLSRRLGGRATHPSVLSRGHGGSSPELFGLNFPSNGDSPSAFVAMQYANPHTNGLPIWGPSGAGTTFIWKVRPRQHTGYYQTVWWSNNGTFFWDSSNPNTFYGAHPYPDTSSSAGTTHSWELATDAGGDYVLTRAGTLKAVVKDVWYTQALRVTRNGDGSKTIVFYINLPSTADGDVIEHTVSSSYGETNPPNPCITFGDSPWAWPNERTSGVLRGIKIFARVLSESEMLTEAASDTITASGIWYANANPTPTDITDKSGQGHHFSWADASNKPTLWTG